MGASAEAAAFPAERPRPHSQLFADVRIREGIKLGLAGMLALYITQLIRLAHSNWSILTVLILMLPKYVGASALKAIMRAVGTIAGALVGIWLVGDYTSTPAIFIPVFFCIVAYSTYKFGKLPASQISYAYFLVGVTTIAVVTNGVLAPGQAWQIGLDRALEILVGIGSSLLVTALVWPRYARDEFTVVDRDALGTVGRLFATRAWSSRAETPAGEQELHQAFSNQLATLRNLLQAGTRESALFHASLPCYHSFLIGLIGLYHAVLDMGRWRQGETFFVDRMRGELGALEKAISDEFAILAATRLPGEGPRPGNLDEAYAAFEHRVWELRAQGAFLAAPVDVVMEFAGHAGALRSIRDNLDTLRIAIEDRLRTERRGAVARHRGEMHSAIDWAWVKAGIKGGIAAVTAVLLIEWINPPGSAAIPFIAWLVSFQGRTFLKAGGTGDQRVFQNGVLAAGGLILCIILLLLGTPFLASYALMNLALFSILFTFGFLTGRFFGFTLWMAIALLSISAFVGLNPQQPVPSQTIIDTFLGVIIGVGIGAIVARLLWPVLPQRVLRDDLLALIARCRALVRGEPAGEALEMELALFSVEATQAARQIRMPKCPAAEKARLFAYVQLLMKLVTQIKALASRRAGLPEAALAILRPSFERLEGGFTRTLDAFAGCFRNGDPRGDFPSFRGDLSAMMQAVEQIRASGMLAASKLEIPLQMLDLANRYRAISETLEECGRIIQSLELELYWGDYAL